MTNYMAPRSFNDLQNIQSAAIDSAREGITITDARQPDNPLLFVNKGFELMTGYSAEEVIGRNCRFLQGDSREQEGLANIRRAIAERQGIQQELLNYRKDGSSFWNRLSITPIFDETGVLTHFIGIQEDITAQKDRMALEAAVARQQLITDITLTAAEKQRAETGRELHDNVNQLLALAMLHTNTAIRSETERLPMLEKSKEVLRMAIAEIRKLSHQLVAPAQDEPLQRTISALLEELREGVSFTAEFRFEPGMEARLNPARKLALYRIVQEQLNNIQKYAQAKTVLIQVRSTENGIVLSVEDDGVGFDPTLFTEGIGLKNMRSRAELEAGRLEVRSAPGQGCLVTVSLQP